MSNKTRIADMSAAYDTSDGLSVGDVIGANTKQKARKASDAVADPSHKWVKASSAAVAAAALAATVASAFADVTRPCALSQGKSRFYTEAV